jgi:hypothetical protein
MIPNPDRDVRCLLGGLRISWINTGLDGPLPNGIDFHETKDACVRRVSVHERGHKKTWEREQIWQCFRCSYFFFGVELVFVFAAGEQVFVVVLRIALFVFLSFRSAFALSLSFCIYEKSRRLRMRHRHVFDLGSINHF